MIVQRPAALCVLLVEHEIDRILLELSGQVAEREADIDLTVVALAELDLALAKAKYADSLKATMPEIVPFREPPRPRRTRHPPQPKAVGQILRHRHVRPEGVVLKHHRRASLVDGQIGHVAGVEIHAAARRRQ